MAIEVVKTKKKVIRKVRKEIFGNRIVQILKDKGMIVQELADLVDKNQSHISAIISKQKKHISLQVAWDIADALGMKIEDVFIKTKPVKVIKKIN